MRNVPHRPICLNAWSPSWWHLLGRLWNFSSWSFFVHDILLQQQKSDTNSFSSSPKLLPFWGQTSKWFSSSPLRVPCLPTVLSPVCPFCWCCYNNYYKFSGFRTEQKIFYSSGSNQTEVTSPSQSEVSSGLHSFQRLWRDNPFLIFFNFFFKCFFLY